MPLKKNMRSHKYLFMICDEAKWEHSRQFHN